MESICSQKHIVRICIFHIIRNLGLNNQSTEVFCTQIVSRIGRLQIKNMDYANVQSNPVVAMMSAAYH